MFIVPFVFRWITSRQCQQYSTRLGQILIIVFSYENTAPMSNIEKRKFPPANVSFSTTLSRLRACLCCESFTLCIYKCNVDPNTSVINFELITALDFTSVVPTCHERKSVVPSSIASAPCQLNCRLREVCTAYK